ncbi:hypothetical protein TUMSATVNIG1_03900 [Vibrio nigripulchritudo]|uniref:hypothetical protein n=1 Tax=Vibrio nigripulchritudo TaxID=28173 RepID=UPI00190D89EC|nr:hypothetical protein [Vibrio nigripulchritudo]BCL68453.1 hypothetical protein VNTUMSATTG_03900 [Vibrio nigripulchritudo]BDU29781.1 hypothetical protein TUMSATVNIG1_03900 [Vibrio nigripulchritudo]
MLYRHSKESESPDSGFLTAIRDISPLSTSLKARFADVTRLKKSVKLLKITPKHPEFT